MTVIRLFCAVVLFAGTLAAQPVAVMPCDSLMEDRASADGWVDREEGESEYPGELKDPATGMTVSWGFDDSLLYLAVETRGKGWFGIGFGAPGMDESNMLVGFYTDDSVGLYNLVGKGNTHTVAGHADSLGLEWDIDFDDETGITAFEVCYPLTWRGAGAPAAFAGNEVLAGSAIPGLAPGDMFDLILAQNTNTPSLMTKHTHRSVLKFRLEGVPAPPGE